MFKRIFISALLMTVSMAPYASEVFAVPGKGDRAVRGDPQHVSRARRVPAAGSQSQQSQQGRTVTTTPSASSSPRPAAPLSGGGATGRAAHSAPEAERPQALQREEAAAAAKKAEEDRQRAEAAREAEAAKEEAAQAAEEARRKEEEEAAAAAKKAEEERQRAALTAVETEESEAYAALAAKESQAWTTLMSLENEAAVAIKETAVAREAAAEAAKAAVEATERQKEAEEKEATRQFVSAVSARLVNPKDPTSSNPRAETLFSWMASPAFLKGGSSSTNADYAIFVKEVGLDPSSAIVRFALVHQMQKGKGPADANSQALGQRMVEHFRMVSVVSAPGVTNPGVRLLAAARDALATQTTADGDFKAQATHFAGAVQGNVIVAAILEMTQSTLATGGVFGMDFGRTANKDEAKVMVGVLSLSGLKATAADTVQDALQRLSQAYLSAAYTLRTLNADEKRIFDAHQQHCFIGAAHPLTSKFDKDEVLSEMEKTYPTHGMTRARVEGVWRDYDALLA